MKIIISSLQVSPNGSKGHLNPAIALALAAKNRGHEVAILPLPCRLSKEDKIQLEKMGLRYLKPPKLPDNIIKSREDLAKLAASEQSYLAYKSFLVDPFQFQIDEVTKIIDQEAPDAILYDMLVYCTPLAGRKLHIPDFGYCAGLKLIADNSLNRSYELTYSKLSPYLKELISERGTNFHNLELLSKNLNFVFAPENMKDYFNIEKNIKLSGALPLTQEPEEECEILQLNKPYAILSFGSVLDPADFLHLTNTVISLCKKLNMQLLISSNKLIVENTPESIIVRSHLPIKDLLPNASLYFHHGGANSFSEATISGTPQIIFPLTTDQPMQADLLKKLKIGFSFQADSFSSKELEAAIQILINNNHPIHNRIKECQNTYQSQNGALNTIKDIEKIVNTRNIYSEKRILEDIRTPRTEKELVEIVKEANQKKMKLYPISTGKNYGLGSRLPIKDKYVLVDLGNMKKILNFDPQGGSITIQPGVTQKDINEYLKRIRSQYILNVTGSTEDSSIIGNIADRGVAHYGIRTNDVISLKVILGNGEIVSTGGESVKESSVSKLYPSGLGPDLKGLFSQSNFGIIFEATIKLIPKECMFGVVNFEKREDVSIGEFVDLLAKLKRQNLLPDNIHISNKNRKQSVIIPLLKKYALLNHDEATKLAEQNIHEAYYANSSIRFDEDIMDLLYLKIKKASQGIANVSLRKESDLNNVANAFDKSTTGIFSHSMGTPSDDALLSLAHSKEQIIRPKQLENLNVGTFFIVPILPFTGNAVTEVDDLVNQELSAEHFTPFITFYLIDHNCLEGVVNLVFNSDDPKEVVKAKSTMLRTFNTLARKGYPPQRMSIFQMPVFDKYEASHLNIVTQIKKLFDPNNVIAPERYGF